MAMTVEEQLWLQNDFAAFERLPKQVRDAIRNHSRKIDVRALRKMARTEVEMLTVIESGAAPI